jgi:2-polyprenyl-3-methyl-5-hydroxy-6-metoxy-1,4-benzoquinol methylase
VWDGLYKHLRPFFQAPQQILAHVEARTSVLDIGCGYGDLCAMIVDQKKSPQVLGIDHDVHKIRVAKTRYGACKYLQFDVADLKTLRHIEQHTVLVIDVLHYFSKVEQLAFLKRVMTQPEVQKVIVRDAIRSFHPGYTITRVHEFLMTRMALTRVQQTQFSFLSKEDWRSVASDLGWQIVFERAGLPIYFDHLMIFTRGSQA